MRVRAAIGLGLAVTLAAALGGCVQERAANVEQQQPSSMRDGGTAPQPAPHPDAEALRRRDYSRIDAHALRATRAAERSLDALATYLSAPARDDADRVRAIYRWLTDRVAYDAAAFFSGRYRNLDSDPDAVLHRRRAVCDGYAELFLALARRSGLEAVKVSGHAKGYGYRIGDAATGPSDHAWNAVRVGGAWYLLDATWGAGSLDEQSRAFRKAFDPHYFLTPPEQFVYRHLPEEPRWQLLARPLDAVQFSALAPVSAEFFRHGLGLVSHPGAVVRSQGEVTVRLSAPPAARLTASLLRDGREVGGEPVLVQREAEQVEVLVRPPRPGDYVLQVYSRIDPGKGEYDGVLRYRLVAARGVGGGNGFPKVYRPFVEREANLESPLQGVLPAGSRQHFRLRVPGAEQVLANVNQRMVPLAQDGEVFSGEVPVPRGPFAIYARFPGGNAYNGLLHYEGR